MCGAGSLMRARVIRREAGAGERWCAPALGTQAGAAANAFVVSDPQHSGLAEAERVAREQGFAQGLAQGRAAAQQQTAAELATLAALSANLREPLAGVDEQIVDELVRLALCVAREVILRELSIDPQLVVAVIEEARRALGEVRGRLCIALHPDEAVLVRGLFNADEALRAVQVDADASITRGGCTLSTEVSFVDASVESRIARIAAQVLGEECAGERDAACGASV